MTMAMPMVQATPAMASLGSLTNRFPHPRVPGAVPGKMKAEKSKTAMVMVSTSPTLAAWYGSPKGGTGLLERPPLEISLPDEDSIPVEEGGDIGRLKDRRNTGSGDSYRVLLLDDERHTEKLVAKVLARAVPSITPDDARRLFSESRAHGVAVVIVTVKEHAEFYSLMMNQGGLRSSIEPDSDTW